MATFDAHEGSVKATARALGISRSTVRSHIEKARGAQTDPAPAHMDGSRGGDDWLSVDEPER